MTKRSNKPPARRKPMSMRVRLRRKWQQMRAACLYYATRGGLIFGGLMGVFLLYCWLTLPTIDSLYQKQKTPSILLQTQSGEPIGSYGEVYGETLTYSDIPKPMIEALLATEDRNFFHHFGFDPIGMLRALWVNMRAGHVVQGGSTVTQQLAKNLFLTPERTASRKIREMLLAFKLEARFSKKDILALYLNRVYLGAGNYGIDAASRRYFGKSARELNLPEAAILAGLLKAPSRFAPTSNPDLSRKRAEQVLANMVDADFIKEPQEKRAIAGLPQALKPSRSSSQSAMYFADWVVDQLPESLTALGQDLVVTVTLDPKMQKAAAEAIVKQMESAPAKFNANQAALVAMDDDGAIRAMVGGKNYGESQFNRATQAHRQPGSSFKLFVYLAALENGFTPQSDVLDEPITVEKWQPKNYNGKYEGAVSLREAFSQSINTVAVRLSETVGRNRVVEMAQRLGITSDLPLAPSIALGAAEVNLLELTGAYAHMAAGGQVVAPYAILQIHNKSGQLLYDRVPQSYGQAVKPSVVAKMNDLLRSVVRTGTGRGAALDRPVAGKTGTTSDYKDAWFIGFAPPLTAGVWVGNDDSTAMKKVSGGMIPAQIWKQFMQAAMAGTPVRDIPTSAEDEITMPWSSDNDIAPHVAVQQEAPPSPHEAPAPEKEDGFTLGPSFWQKLDAIPVR